VDREQIEQIHLGKSETQAAGGQPTNIPVEGLPSPLKAEVFYTPLGYSFKFTNSGGIGIPYDNKRERTADLALKALKELLIRFSS